MKKTTPKPQQKPIGLTVKNRDTNNNRIKVCQRKAGSIDKKRNLKQLIDRCTKCKERYLNLFGAGDGS